METIKTFFIQCNRELSQIDGDDDPDLNSLWTTNLGTDGFQLQKGDMVYLDNASLQVIGSSDSNQTMEFTGDNQVVNGRSQPFTDNRVLVEFGYTLNQNLPQGPSGFSLSAPFCLPGSSYLSNAQQIQVNNGSYTVTPSVGFNFQGNNNYIIYGFLNEVDTFYNHFVSGEGIKTLYLCNTSDTIDASGVGINPGAASFKWKKGQNVQYIPEDDEYVTYTFGSIDTIDVSSGRITVTFTTDSTGTYPTIIENTAVPNPAFLGRIAASVTYPQSNLGMGLFNASNNSGSTTDNGSYFYDMTKQWLDADGPRGFRNKNRRQGFDNLPYQFVRNDYQGTQPTPNGMKMSPRLKPMTSFCLLDIKNNLTNVNDVAVELSEKLQQVNPVWGSQKAVIKYLKEKSKKNKGNNIVPYVQSLGYEPGNVYGRVTWNTVAKLFTSNTLKCQPANLQLGQDKINDVDINNTLNNDPDGSNYLHSGTQPSEYPDYWNNQIYGNMAVQNIYRAMAGDTINRLKVWDGNIVNDLGVIHLERNIHRVCLLNTSIATHGVQIDVSGETLDISGSYIPENGCLFTNIHYTEENIKDIAEAFKTARSYNKDFKTWDEQLKDVDGWFFEADCGMTNDYSSNPTAFSTDAWKYDPARYVPIQPPWINTFPPAANPATNPDGIGRNISVISPNMSAQGVGDDEILASGLGKIKVKTQYNPTYKSILYDHNDTVCNVDVNSDLVDITLPETNNVGAYPYNYTDISGKKHTFVYFLSRQTYDVSGNGNNPGFGQVELLQLTWGDLFGYSFAALDNYKVVPTNGDKKRFRLMGNLDFKYVENWSNFIGIGAANPSIQYNSQTNKFQFGNMNTNVFVNSVLGTASAQLGEQIAIINQDLSYNELMNSYVLDGNDVILLNQTNLGIQAEQTGIYIYKIHLPSKKWKEPDDIDLNSYWDNSSMEATERNHAKILENTIEATEENFSKTLFGRLGFNYYDLYPRYPGNYGNRYTSESFNNQEYSEASTHLVKTDNVLNTAANPSLNLFYDKLSIYSEYNGTIQYGLGSMNGVPEFVQTSTDFLNANNEASLSQCGVFNIVSDIVPSSFNNGEGVTTNTLYQLSKSYTSGNYIYGGGSAGYPVYEPRTVTKVKIEVRNPNTNALAKISPSSSITFRVVRKVVIPIDIPPPMSKASKEDDDNDDEDEALTKAVEKTNKSVEALVDEEKQDNVSMDALIDKLGTYLDVMKSEQEEDAKPEVKPEIKSETT